MKLKVLAVRTVVVLFLGAALALPSALERLRANARQSESKALLAATFIAQHSYHNEWKTYSIDFAKIGFQPEGRVNNRLYLIADEIPETIRRLIPKSALPFANDDHFVALAILPTDNQLEFWTINEKKELLLAGTATTNP